jgi:hypothetical protein
MFFGSDVQVAATGNTAAHRGMSRNHWSRQCPR